MDTLANPSWPVVLIAVFVLALARLTLRQLKHPIAKQVAEIAESLAVAIFLVFLIIRPFVVQAYFIPSGSMRPTLLEGDRILVNKFIYRFREPRRGDIIVFKSPLSANKDEKDFIKRVIGLPGDKIKLLPGYVTVDGQVYQHPELRTALIDFASRGNQRDVQVKLTRHMVYVDGKEVTKADIGIAAGRPGANVIIHPGSVYRNGKLLKESYVAEDPDQPYPDANGGTKQVPKGSLFVMGDNRNQSSDSRVWGLLDRQRVEGEAMFLFWPVNRIRWVR
ncbi:MAG: signal peptidase I [Armatimonadota bacterium]|nr:signal peptidase I [Armatimonadota bacterium]